MYFVCLMFFINLYNCVVFDASSSHTAAHAAAHLFLAVSLTCLSTSCLDDVAVAFLLPVAWTLNYAHPSFLAKPRLDFFFFGQFNPTLGFSCRFDVCLQLAVWALVVPAHVLSAVLLFQGYSWPTQCSVRSYSWPTKQFCACRLCFLMACS